MAHLATIDRRIVETLIAALAGGTIRITHGVLDGLVSAYRPDDGTVTLNPDVSAYEQALGLIEALEGLAAIDDNPAVRGPRLRLLQGGAA